jgi:hypothetical protein
MRALYVIAGLAVVGVGGFLLYTRARAREAALAGQVMDTPDTPTRPAPRPSTTMTTPGAHLRDLEQAPLPSTSTSGGTRPRK